MVGSYRFLPALVLSGLLAILSTAQAQTVVTLPGSYALPYGVAVDSSGNVFVADEGKGTVVELLAPDYTTSNPIGGSGVIGQPRGLALDASGNLFVVDGANKEDGQSAVEEIPVAGGYAQTNILFESPLSEPAGIAIDQRNGNLFVTNGLTLYEAAAPYSTMTQIAVANGHFESLIGAAIDGSGNLFVTDSDSSTIKEVTAASGYVTVTTLAIDAALGNPRGIAVAAGGDLVVADVSTDGIYKIQAPDYTSAQELGASGSFITPAFLASDRLGNLFVGDFGNGSTGMAVREIESAPTVMALSPPNGPPAGGTSVTITGTNFMNDTTVLFGATAASSVTVNSDTSITAIAPAGALGTVDVTVNSGLGTSAVSAADQFTWSNIRATTTTLDSSVNPATALESETFTAHVVETSNSAAVTEGTVQFSDNGAVIDGCGAVPTQANGNTSCSVFLAAGSHSMVVVYSGDTNFATSTSATLTEQVNVPVSAPTGGSPVALTEGHLATPFTPVTSFTGGTTPYTYSTSSTLPAGLSIDPNSGQISGTPSVTIAATSFTVTATDVNGSSAGNSFTLTINPAVAVAPVSSTVTLTQNEPSLSSQATVTASGGTGGLTYGIAPTLPAGLSFSTTDGTISGSPTGTHAASSFTVTATDTQGASNAASFSLAINQAVAASGGTSTVRFTQGRAALSFKPVTGSLGTGALTYSIPGPPTLPAGLSIDSGTGTISGTPTATATQATYSVKVTDTNNASASNTFIMTVNAPVTAPTGGAPVTLTQGHLLASSFTPVTSFTGGSFPYSYSVNPALPAGLTLDPDDGSISGTPSVALAATSFTVTETDQNGSAAGNSFTLTVNQAVTATQAVPVENLTQNRQATSFTPVTGANGTGALTYSISPTLPTGLTFDTASGTIGGTPSVSSGRTTYTVIATDTLDATASNTFQLTVNAPLVANVSVATETLTQAQPSASFTPITSSGGTTPLGYSVSPTLPAGLSLASGTGLITGIPTGTLAAANFTVTVTDANGATDSGSFSLAVNGPVTAAQAIASKSLTVDTPAAAFTPVTGAGGTGALTYSVAPTLPAGIGFVPSTGAISGLPTITSAATTYTVTVTDQNNATASASFSLAVNGAVTASTAIPATTLTQNHAGPAFTPVTGGGGTSPYTYSVSPTLPAGLSLGTSTGAVSGPATVTAATTSYTVTVTDLNGASKTADFSLTVDPQVTAIAVVPSTSLKVNQVATAFTPVTGGGGTRALTYSVAPGLPAGLSLDPATGAVSGKPSVTQATTNYTVTVTDTNNATATAGFTLAVTTTSSSVTLSSSLNPANAGQAVTLTAAVSGTGGTPSGTVVFKDGATTLFTGTLAGGLSSYTSSTLAAGTHAISVTYSGDSLFAGSSGGLSQVVNQVSTAPPTQVYTYKGTLPSFSSPGKGVTDLTNGHILIADTGNQRVEVISASTLATLAIIGTTGVAGSDNAHFNDPTGVAFVGATDQIFVSDTGNDRIQVFNAVSFAYVGTISGTAGNARLLATGDTSFSAPGGIYADAGRLYVADTGNQRVQIFDAATMSYVATLGSTGIAGVDNAHFNAPADVTVNDAVGEILVADSGNARIQRFDAATFAFKGTIGGAAGGSDHFGTPLGIGYDPTSKLVLVADSAAQRVQAFDALSYNYVLTLGTGTAGTGNDQFSSPAGVSIDTAHQQILVADQKNNRVQIFAVAPTVAFASVLPGSRSVELGQPATIFASMINAGATPLQGCAPALPVTAPAGLSLSYQTTDPATNALTGTQGKPATIAANNGVQSFLVTFQGNQAFSASDMALDFGCLGIGPAAVATGVDTVDLAMSTAPVADVIALAATASNDGIAKIPAGGASAFAVASSNVGATSQIVVSVDTGSASLPLTATLCQSNPSTGACLATPSTSVTLSDASGAAPTFSVFLQATGTIPFAPAASRVFVRFKDPSGGLHGSTSVAVETGD